MDVGAIVRDRMDGCMYIVSQRRETLGIGHGKVGKMYVYDIITADGSTTVDESTMRGMFSLVTTTGVPVNMSGVQVGRVVNPSNLIPYLCRLSVSLDKELLATLGFRLTGEMKLGSISVRV